MGAFWHLRPPSTDAYARLWRSRSRRLGSSAQHTHHPSAASISLWLFFLLPRIFQSRRSQLFSAAHNHYLLWESSLSLPPSQPEPSIAKVGVGSVVGPLSRRTWLASTRRPPLPRRLSKSREPSGMNSASRSRLAHAGYPPAKQASQGQPGPAGADARVMLCGHRQCSGKLRQHGWSGCQGLAPSVRGGQSEEGQCAAASCLEAGAHGVRLFGVSSSVIVKVSVATPLKQPFRDPHR